MQTHNQFLQKISSQTDRQILERIALFLEKIAHQNKPVPKFGLQMVPTIKTLYVEREFQEQECWYLIDRYGRTAVSENSIVGFILAVETEVVDDEEVLQITVNAGSKYILESPIDGSFSYSVLQSLNKITSVQFLNPICIIVHPGIVEKSVIAEIVIHNQTIKYNHTESIDPFQLVKQISATIPTKNNAT